MIKKYILKPGRHQFVPGSHAVHHNNNLTDKEAEWYLTKYPHIASMFEAIPGEISTETDSACRVSDEDQLAESPIESLKSQPIPITIGTVESSTQSVESNNNITYEDLPSAN